MTDTHLKMYRLILVLTILLTYATIQITYHPITKWVCDGRRNKIGYYHYDASMIHITIEKQPRIVDRDLVSKDHLNIWMFFGWPNGIWNLQWLKLTETLKLETT